MANEKTKININRILAFLAGGLLVFAVMSVTVVNRARKDNEALSAQLDVSRFEAGRLLSDAQAQFAARDYTSAITSLNRLVENQPGSPEAVTGRALLIEIRDAVSDADARWEEALPGIREAWSTEMAARLLAESDAARVALEAGMDATVREAWERAAAGIRRDWEAGNSLDG